MQRYTELIIEESKVRHWKVCEEECSKQASSAVLAGRYHSGMNILLHIEIGQTYIDRLLDDLFEAEKAALIQQAPSDNYFTSLIEEIINLIDKEYTVIFESINQRLKQLPGVTNLIVDEGGKKKLAAFRSIDRRVQMLQEELRLGIDKSSPKTRISVTGNVGVINVGQVYGNIQVKLAQMKNSNMNDLVEAFEKLVSTVKTSVIAEKEMCEQMENIEFLISQSAIPNDKRNRGVIKTIEKSLSVAANIATVWGEVGPVIMKALGLS
jgi:hypothetical protein